jgi:MerR family transcriptional regulator, redox-sensitive transcriptional activator SoxR
MRIGELGSESGVCASTIRYWERIGVLPRPARVSCQRRYSREVIHIIAVLRLAQACGFHLDEVRQLLHGCHPGVSASRRWRELPQRKRVELNNQIERLRAMRPVTPDLLPGTLDLLILRTLARGTATALPSKSRIFLRTAAFPIVSRWEYDALAGGLSRPPMPTSRQFRRHRS